MDACTVLPGPCLGAGVAPGTAHALDGQRAQQPKPRRIKVKVKRKAAESAQGGAAAALFGAAMSLNERCSAANCWLEQLAQRIARHRPLEALTTEQLERLPVAQPCSTSAPAAVVKRQRSVGGGAAALSDQTGRTNKRCAAADGPAPQATRVHVDAAAAAAQQQEIEQLRAARLRDAQEIAQLRGACERAATAAADSQAQCDALRAQLEAGSTAHHAAEAALATAKHDAAAAAADAAATARKAAADALRPFELRVGTAAAASSLLDISKHKVHASIAEKKWREYAAAAAAKPPACPAAAADSLAAAVQKGLLSVVMAFIAAANVFEQSMTLTPAARKAEVRAARSAIKAAQRRLAALTAHRKQLDAMLADARAAGASAAGDATHARHTCVARAAEIFIERLHAVAELQHLAFEHVSLEQTLRHARLKRDELLALKEGVKQLSPASESSCLEAAPPHLSPSVYVPTAQQPPLPAAPPPPLPPSEGNTRAHRALHVAADLDAVVARLQTTVDAMVSVTATAPRLRHRLSEFFSMAAALPHAGVAARAADAGWALAAIGAEFGCGVRGNAGALSHACEAFLALAKGDAAR